jgi:hypothetical protein
LITGEFDMHKLILGAWARKSMSPLDRIASRRRPLQFAAAGSSFTGVDSPASAQSTSASSSPDAGATGISPEATSARSWAPEAGLEVADSLLEEDGFELVVPLSKRTAVPSSPFDFPVDGIGCERSNLRKQRFRVPGS